MAPMPGEDQHEAPPTAPSESPLDGAFWGATLGDVRHGFQRVVDRLVTSKESLKALASFARELASIEDAYGRALGKLANRALPREEVATTRAAWASLTAVTAEHSSQRRGFAEFLRTAVANEVVAHKDAQKSVRKSLAAHEATLAKEVQAKAAHLKRLRDAYIAKARADPRLSFAGEGSSDAMPSPLSGIPSSLGAASGGGSGSRLSLSEIAAGVASGDPFDEGGGGGGGDGKALKRKFRKELRAAENAYRTGVEAQRTQETKYCTYVARAYEKVEAMESDRIEFMRATLTVFADRLAEMGALETSFGNVVASGARALSVAEDISAFAAGHGTTSLLPELSVFEAVDDASRATVLNNNPRSRWFEIPARLRPSAGGGGSGAPGDGSGGGHAGLGHAGGGGGSESGSGGRGDGDEAYGRSGTVDDELDTLGLKVPKVTEVPPPITPISIVIGPIRINAQRCRADSDMSFDGRSALPDPPAHGSDDADQLGLVSPSSSLLPPPPPSLRTPPSNDTDSKDLVRDFAARGASLVVNENPLFSSRNEGLYLEAYARVPDDLPAAMEAAEEGRLRRAVVDWVGGAEFEMVFFEDDLIEIVQEDASGWCLGRLLNGEEGLFLLHHTVPVKVEDFY